MSRLKFTNLLNAAIRTIAALEETNVKAIQDSLGEEIDMREKPLAICVLLAKTCSHHSGKIVLSEQ